MTASHPLRKFKLRHYRVVPPKAVLVPLAACIFHGGGWVSDAQLTKTTGAFLKRPKPPINASRHCRRHPQGRMQSHKIIMCEMQSNGGLKVQYASGDVPRKQKVLEEAGIATRDASDWERRSIESPL